jgi:hypothetical protein
MTIGINGFDTIFIIIVGLSGFIMGAAACRDIEKVFKNDTATQPTSSDGNTGGQSLSSLFDRLWSGTRSIVGLLPRKW